MFHLRHNAIAAVVFALLVSPAEARGKFDGFHGCRCGTTAARLAGLPYIFRGINLKQAVGWLAFVRTEIKRGAVGYVRHGGPTGHVYTVLSYNGVKMATVEDDRGTYERDVRNATFVEPGVLR